MNMARPNFDRVALVEPPAAPWQPLARPPQQRRAPKSHPWLLLADRAVITITLAMFVLATFRTEWPFVEFFQTEKWDGYLVLLAYAFLRNLTRLRIPKPGLSTLFLALPVVGMVSSFREVFSIADAGQRVFAFFALFALAFVIPVPPDPGERLRIWLASVVDVCTGVIAISLALSLSSHYYQGGRFFGCIYHPNYLAAYAAFGALASLPKILNNPLHKKIYPLLVFSGGVFCLVASNARADSVGLAAACCAILFKTVSRKNAWMVVCSILVIGAGLYFARDIVNQFSPMQIKTREIVISDRTNVWSRQMKVFLEKPFLGWGFEMQNEKTGAGRLNAEGSYTELLAAVGLAGAIPFIIGIFAAAFRYSRLLSRLDAPGFVYQRYRTELIAGFGMVSYVLIVSVAEVYLATVGTVIPITFWVFMGCVCLMPLPQRRRLVHVGAPRA